MDKYLLLVRLVVREVFAEMFVGDHEHEYDHEGSSSSSLEVGAGREQIALLEAYPLSPRERMVPDGLRYHVLDVYVDELERAIGKKEEEEGDDDGDGGEISEETRRAVERLLVPVETMAREGLSKGVRLRAKETLADERVLKWRTKEATGGGGGGEEAREHEWEGLD